jgi:hypothetical protein
LPQKAERLRGDLDELVLLDELQRLLEAHRFAGDSRTASSEPDARMFVSFFSLVTLTSRSFAPGVLADDHALVDLVAGAMNIVPRSWTCSIAYAVERPAGRTPSAGRARRDVALPGT